MNKIDLLITSILGFQKRKHLDKYYLVFPSKGKGGIDLGATQGRGNVYEKGEVISEAKMAQVKFLPQWGAPAYSEVIIFDKATLELSKNGELQFSEQVSAVTLAKGASTHIA